MSLALRKATLNDSDQLFRWRNDPDVIATSTSQRAVTEAEHDRWLIKVLSDKTLHLYIAVVSDNDPVGMGRIKDEDDLAVLSYSIAAEHRGQGFGGQLVAALCDKAYELGFTSIQAVVRRQNTASLKSLLSNGFTIQANELLVLKK